MNEETRANFPSCFARSCPTSSERVPYCVHKFFIPNTWSVAIFVKIEIPGGLPTLCTVACGLLSRGVTRALIWGGGCIFIYSCSARRISFEMNLISKEIRRAEHEYMNIHPPPPINALVTPLLLRYYIAHLANFPMQRITANNDKQ